MSSTARAWRSTTDFYSIVFHLRMPCSESRFPLFRGMRAAQKAKRPDFRPTVLAKHRLAFREEPDGCGLDTRSAPAWLLLLCLLGLLLSHGIHPFGLRCQRGRGNERVEFCWPQSLRFSLPCAEHCIRDYLSQL